MLCPNAVDFFWFVGSSSSGDGGGGGGSCCWMDMRLAPSSGMLTFTLRWCNGGNRLRNGLRKLSINGWVGC